MVVRLRGMWNQMQQSVSQQAADSKGDKDSQNRVTERLIGPATTNFGADRTNNKQYDHREKANQKGRKQCCQ